MAHQSDEKDVAAAPRPAWLRTDVVTLLVGVAAAVLTWSQLSTGRAIWVTAALVVGALGVFAHLHGTGVARACGMIGSGAGMLGCLAMVQAVPLDPQPEPTSAERIEPSDYVLRRSGIEYVQLRRTRMPQNNFRPKTWSYAETDDAGVTYECRLAADPQLACRPGQPPVFHLDPVEPGALIAAVKGPVTDAGGCATAAYRTGEMPIRKGEGYCVRSNDWLLLINVQKLPTQIVDGGTVVIDVQTAYWEPV
ncbi:MAG TPA: hypothetical protein VF657_25745 [Actinoplanes sp.]|jgi:hypothetical protein